MTTIPRLLTIVLTLFIICGFTVTPIAGAEYQNDTTCDITLDNINLNGIESLTFVGVPVYESLSSLHQNAGSQSSENADEEDSHAILLESDEVMDFVTQNPDMTVKFDDKVVTADDITEYTADNPDQEYAVDPQFDPTCQGVVVVRATNGKYMTVELDAHDWFGFINHRKLQSSTTGETTFVLNVKGPDYDEINAINCITNDTCETWGGVTWGPDYEDTYDSPMRMPAAGEILTYDITFGEHNYDTASWWTLLEALAVGIAVCAIAMGIAFLVTNPYVQMVCWGLYWTVRAITHCL